MHCVCPGSGPLDVRIKRLAGQRDDLQDTVRRLKLDLEEERGRASMARGAAHMEEAERWGHKFEFILYRFGYEIDRCLLSGKLRNCSKITSLEFPNLTKK